MPWGLGLYWAGPAIPMRGEISPEGISQRLLDAANIAGIEKPKALIDVVEGYSPRTRQQQSAYISSVKKTADELARQATRMRALPSVDEAAIQQIESAAIAGRQAASAESKSIITGLRPGFIATPLLVRGGAGALGGAGGAQVIGGIAHAEAVGVAERGAGLDGCLMDGCVLISWDGS